MRGSALLSGSRTHSFCSLRPNSPEGIAGPHTTANTCLSPRGKSRMTGMVRAMVRSTKLAAAPMAPEAMAAQAPADRKAMGVVAMAAAHP